MSTRAELDQPSGGNRFLAAGVALLLLALGSSVAGATQPNILLIIADDCTYRDLEVYGGQAKTPNLVKLAGEGMKFTRCFQAAPTCSPTRHSLYTGLYPVKSGAYPNHTMAYDWVKSMAHYLQAAGYRTHLSGKTHIKPKSVFPFEYSGRQNNPDLGAVKKFFGECAEAKQPFLLIAASNEPHSPWNKGNVAAYPKDKLKLSPIQVDTPETRAALPRYLAEITYFDSQVGELLAALDTQGLQTNTIVIVLSEQGYDLPFAKWTCYDAGLQSGCIVRWPGKVKPASVSDALVEYVDVVPTFLEAANQSRPEILDGQSFLPVLLGQTNRHKDYVYGQETSRGIIAGPEYYGIRTVRNERYRYILNLTPEATFKNTTTGREVFASWRRAGTNGNAHAAKLVHEFQHRPAEELYDCEKDPWNRTNLIAEPKLVAMRNELRGKLDAWMKQQGDEGQATELNALKRMPARAGNAAGDGDD